MDSYTLAVTSIKSPPDGSVLSRALIRDAISLRLEAQLLPQPWPLLSRNARDGASATYRRN
jgi:hypothetical protein